MVERITTAQLRAARALVRMEQAELARRSGVSVPTIGRMEGADGPVRGTYENVSALMHELEAAGVEFIPAENEHGPGVRLKRL